MKKNLIYLSIVLLILFNQQIYAQPVISLKINTGFQIPEAKLVQSLTEEIMRRNNLLLTFQSLPNQRALINANTGEDDGEAARVYEINKYYPNLLPTEEAIHDIEVVIISKQRLHITDKQDLSAYHVGVIRGMKIAEIRAAQSQSKSLFKATEINSLLNMLDSNRLDIALVDKVGFLNTIRNYPDKNYFLYTPPLIKRALHFHLHKKHQKLLPQINQSLKEMKADGSFNHIRDEFFNQFDQVYDKSVTIIPYDKQ